ncbi:MAG: class I SAM-dependent methyltransferase [Clostridia bacterium]
MENVFNHFYQDYDAWYETASGRFVDRVETDALLGLLNPRPGMEVLEVGCGTGNYLLKLAGAGCRITGIDIAPHMLEQARAKLTRHGISAALSIMNGKSLSFTDGIFDAAYSMAAFEFIDDIETVYREMRRVVRPGGDIVIGTIQRGSSWEQLYSSDACKGTAFEYASFRTADEIAALDPGHCSCVTECLFPPPGLPDAEYRAEAEQQYRSQGQKGGFVCVKFVK